MKTHVLIGSLAVLTGSLLSAQAGPADDVKSAAEKLAAQSNYSWRTTVKVGDESRFRPGPTEGKTEKGGWTHLSMTRGESTMEIVMKGDKGAIKTEEGWQSFAEATADDQGDRRNPARFMARRMQTFKAPAAQAQDLLAKAKDLKKSGEAYTGELTEEGAKELLTFGPRPSGAEGPAISGAKGSVSFWIKDGLLTKCEFTVQGTITFNNNDMNADRTTTVEIKDVGSTKLVVPAEAKKKLS
jgi:hypothetical protein